MSGTLDQVSLAIGELRQSSTNMQQAIAHTNDQVSEINTKLDDLILRDREFRTAMKVGSKVTYFFVALIGGLVSTALHWLFPNLGK